ncbi:MAG: SAF domain-containing protein [Actinomycetaceae bacterium]|nr:SAF domain-containing protein [Actinomycetaceae bacterium]MDY6082726.1 SAF domain-containing protein [Actinomycetaceae bacterium]
MVLRLKALAWRYRYFLLAALFCVTLGVVGNAIATRHPTMVNAVVAARDIPAGTALSSDDIRVEHFPAASLPTYAISDPKTASGAVLAVPASTGLPITTRMIVDESFFTPPDEAHVVIPVQFSDAGSLAIAQPGVHVKLFAVSSTADNGRATMICDSATIAGLGQEEKASMNLTSSSTTPAQTVFVTVPNGDANIVLGMATTGEIRAVAAHHK